MVVYVNQNDEIKDVDVTSDHSLTPLEIDDEYNPFAGWTVAKICCYRVQVKDGRVIMMTPYVDSRLIDHIDQLGKMSDDQQVEIDGLGDAIIEMSEIIYA